MDRCKYIAAVLLTFIIASCESYKKPERPNIILIMVDDMGYECLSCNGSTSYNTPVLDHLASNGIRFSHCISQPLCTPSRVKIMTGLYNYRNYDYFGHLENEAYTFGNLMKDAGYATCIAGKWQLNGLAYKNEIPYWEDQTRPIAFGFDEYCLWQLTKSRNEGERYARPLIEQNGEVLKTEDNDYGPDIFTRYLLDFMTRKKDEPFFIYYPMVLVHEPFVPTPESPDWVYPSLRYKTDTSYFRDMVAYTDYIIGEIITELRRLDIEDKTIIIFTGDNGTHPSIYSLTYKGLVQGGKGNTIDAGVHVPLIIYWPQIKNKGFVYDGLIEFSDFFPTLAEITGQKVETDGHSFYPLLAGKDLVPRETVFVHYDPKWSQNVNQYRNQFVQTIEFKLYQDGRLFNLANDILEKKPLIMDSLNDKELHYRSLLKKELDKHPAWKK